MQQACDAGQQLLLRGLASGYDDRWSAWANPIIRRVKSAVVV